MSDIQKIDEHSDKEAARIRDDTLKRMLSTPPVPQKPKQKRTGKRVQKGQEKPSGGA